MTTITMTETIQESLLDNLLKTRYPLTYYLNRQQEFGKVFSTTQTNATRTPFEYKTYMLYKRKGPPPSCYYVPDTNNPQASEFNDRQNGFNSDQDYYTTHDQSSEIDDDDTQEYDQKPLLKSIHKKHTVKQR